MKKQKTFLGIPGSWNKPTWKKIKERTWNKKNHRLFTPRVFGWGYTINFYELLYHRRKLLFGITVVIALLSFFAIKQAIYVDKAHQIFDNYYSFRGCVKLLKRTDTYGICKTAQGDTIKIVQFNNKWYLDGDLPVCIVSVCL